MENTNIVFYKMHGAGNDFIVMNDQNHSFSNEEISKMCDRRFGIGGDGLIIIKKHEKYSFEMVYYNNDGSQSLCGNGSRCAVYFAKQFNYFEGDECEFLAYDGKHKGKVTSNQKEEREGEIEIEMREIEEKEIEEIKEEREYTVNTGSPHYVSFLKGEELLDQIDFLKTSHSIRYSPAYSNVGINVNFVQISPTNDNISVRTYERGVEGETLACGTGSVACALAYYKHVGSKEKEKEVKVKCRGGNLRIKFVFDENDKKFKNVYLCGPAKFVFEGKYLLQKNIK
eukprot:TRINITY_DN7075_c0_g1_i1.p1 TRINITY_DN7075_c0_g1~~TRINITY_DN7075_c0_g1_i1.p1  ORF type:complete len:284 (-),score=87.90 TRINITY_DN7075_c0_g1_i1:6-857(-)